MQTLSLKAFFSGLLTCIGILFLLLVATVITKIVGAGLHHAPHPTFSGTGNEPAIDATIAAAGVIGGYVAAARAAHAKIGNAIFAVLPVTVFGLAGTFWHPQPDMLASAVESGMVIVGAVIGGYLNIGLAAKGWVIPWGAACRSAAALLAGFVAALIVFFLANLMHLVLESPVMALTAGATISYLLAPSHARKRNFTLFHGLALIAAVLAFWHAATLHAVRNVNWLSFFWIAASYFGTRSLYLKKSASKPSAA